MSSIQKSEEKHNTIEADKVAEYLRQHPDFFEHHPDVLADIEINHQCEGAVSLIERQIRTLRQQYQDTQKQLDSLIQIARDNDKLNERMHFLTLSVMDAATLNDVYIALDDSLRGDFKADAVNVKLFVDPDKIAIEPDNELMQTVFVPINDPKLNDFRSVLSSEKPVCGDLQPERVKYLFGNAADSIKSTALIPLGGDLCTTIDCPFLGLLAIGSQDPKRFAPNMGTLFLSNLGDIVSRAIRPHLDPKPTHG